MTSMLDIANLIDNMDIFRKFYKWRQSFSPEQEKITFQQIKSKHDYIEFNRHEDIVVFHSNLHFSICEDGGINWTFQICIEEEVAKVSANLGADYKSHPYQVNIKTLFYKEETELENLNNVLDQASDAFLSEMQRLINNQELKAIWEAGKQE